MPLRAHLILRSERSERLEGRTAVMQRGLATGVDNVHGLQLAPNVEEPFDQDSRRVQRCNGLAADPGGGTASGPPEPDAAVLMACECFIVGG